MTDNILDIIGQVLWYGMFITPLITVPYMWRNSVASKPWRIVFGLLLALLCSFILFLISMAIFLRDGLGPT